jgi:hypothetical protein
MSQYSDQCITLKQMLIKHIDNVEVVIDVFYNCITNQEWSDLEICNILQSGVGISSQANIILENLVKHHLQWVK